MKGRRWIDVTGLVIVALVAAGGGTAGAAEQEEAMPDMEAMMKLASPGEHHQHLAHSVGKFEYEMKVWMAPGQPPTATNGTVESRWILDGRFVESVWKGDFMGMPFEGHGLDGYDNGAQQYVSSWIDNMGTMILVAKGDCSRDGRVRTMASEFIDPMTGQPAKMRSVLTVKDDDAYRFEMFMIGSDGSEFKNMEMSAKRR